jgi:hypothetical protein
MREGLLVSWRMSGLFPPQQQKHRHRQLSSHPNILLPLLCTVIGASQAAGGLAAEVVRSCRVLPSGGGAGAGSGAGSGAGAAGSAAGAKGPWSPHGVAAGSSKGKGKDEPEDPAVTALLALIGEPEAGY